MLHTLQQCECDVDQVDTRESRTALMWACVYELRGTATLLLSMSVIVITVSFMFVFVV